MGIGVPLRRNVDGLGYILGKGRRIGLVGSWPARFQQMDFGSLRAGCSCAADGPNPGFALVAGMVITNP